MVVPDTNPSRHVAFLKQSCGFSTRGAQWHMLPQSYPNYKTVHRRFQAWCRDEILRRVLTDVANELRDRGALDEEECFPRAINKEQALPKSRRLRRTTWARSRKVITTANGTPPKSVRRLMALRDVTFNGSE
jgi:transposase